jgi:hypothetical protein
MFLAIIRAEMEKEKEKAKLAREPRKNADIIELFPGAR